MNMQNIRDQFPFFKNHKNLIYFDNAATTQKPQQVLDAIKHYYEYENAPVHRGVYALAERATEQYEQARVTVAQYIGAHPDEVVFTKGTTEGINLVAASYAAQHFKPGDEIIITELEHHANLVPWIQLQKTHKIVLKYIPIFDNGELDYEAYTALLSERTKLVALTHTSNVLGTHVDIPLILERAHAHGARVLVDAAQAVGHGTLNAHDLKVDFLAFSAHKMYGPTGIGALYIAREMQSLLSPYQFGGGMVYEVGMHTASWAKPPRRFEAGTPPIAQAIGFAQAVRFMQDLSLEELQKHETSLVAQLMDALAAMPAFRILGSPARMKQFGHVVSFVHKTKHPHDIAAYLDASGICVRAGDHCAQPLHKRLGLSGSLRVSFAPYNTPSEVDCLIELLSRIV